MVLWLVVGFLSMPRKYVTSVLLSIVEALNEDDDFFPYITSSVEYSKI